MGTYIIRRVVAMILMLIALSMIVFLLFQALPADPAALTCGKSCSPQVIQQNRVRLGYDKPLYEQYWQFVKGIFVGREYGSGTATFECPAPCLGYSFLRQENLTTLLKDRLAVTAAEAVGACILWLIAGISLGILAALKRGRWQDRSAQAVALIGYSFPTFFIGLVLQYLVFFKFRIMDYASYVPFSVDPVGWFKAFLLPWITPALVYAAFYSRLTRNQMLETLGEDYIRTARSKGLPERTVIRKHALRAGLTPIVTAVGLDLAVLLGGVVITETIFGLPGLGKIAVESVDQADLPVITGTVLLAATFVILANLIVDLLYAVIDPESEAVVTFLEVEDLHVQFTTDDGIVRAVDGVSFEVDKGRTLAIVGESGSGKSVTSGAIMGLHNRKRTKITGSIRLDGEELVTAKPERLRELRGKRMAMIFQDPLSSLHPFYTVGKQLVEAVQVHRDINRDDARKRAIELLKKVGIPNAERRAGEYPHQLSGGMRQRVMIAMALINGPDLLIADEPTTALDVTVQAQIIELLKSLQSEFGTAIILITHDLGVVAESADDVAVMYGARVVERGTVRDIFYRPQMPYTWGLLSSLPRLDDTGGGRLKPIPGQPPSLINLPQGCVFRPRCQYHQYVTDGRCDTVRPMLDEVADGHSARCHLSQADKQRLAAERLVTTEKEGA